MHRFFVSIPLEKDIVIPNGELYHQIVHVFRARIGEKIVLFSEGTNDMFYEITAISKKSLSLSFSQSFPNAFSLPKRSLIVFQSYPNKLATLELLIQKFTELWVGKVVFWKSEHSQMQDISDAKKTRIAAIACEALEQCGANKPLQIEYSPQGLGQLLDMYLDYTHIVGHYEGQELQKIPQETPVAFWIGPEGGWSKSEKQFFEEQKITLWKFNNRVLRLETAAIVGVGILMN